MKNTIVLRDDGLAKISKIIRKSKKYMNKNDSFEIFCIVDGRRIFNSSQLDNPIFHDLVFDKPLYGQNPIPMMDSPNNYELYFIPGDHKGSPLRVDLPTITNYAL